MSEQILKALMQLFAIIAKQDEGIDKSESKFVENFLKSQLSENAVVEYLQLFSSFAATEENKNKRAAAKAAKRAEKLAEQGLPPEISVLDSVRVLGICRRINKTLTLRQKVVVLVRLFELVATQEKRSERRIEIINTVTDVFNIDKDEYKQIETFVLKNKDSDLDNQSILIINDKDSKGIYSKKIQSETLHGSIVILQVKSAELYFVKYTGKQDVFLNGPAVYNNRIYLFSPGSTIRLPKGKPVYYSDVVATFLADKNTAKLSFIVKDMNFKFPSGYIGLRNINFAVNQGKLVGIMGASGAGKTTMLNALAGITTPTEGSVEINGINLHSEHHLLEGVIGLIPQDDLLIEELTVFENLFYNAKLCFKDLSDLEITKLVDKTLKDLGLHDRKALKVGNPMNKTISGGQRKRLNIALELIREPSILFVDEPTSGLSSRDSENVMDLLSELTLKGKLIFVVIHQPSSEIYKMFDRMMILDTGGYMIYYGNPVEAVVYFKTIDNQINSGIGECPVCGNVTPEIIFDIVEAQVVDEFGQYTEARKITPLQWEKHYNDNLKVEEAETISDSPPINLGIPNWFKQMFIFVTRDVLSKISNTQYITLNLLEAPLLGFILSFLIRYIADPTSSVYVFYDNENIPPYIFMSIVVALFLGLTVSAEEIFRDRKILKREKFLNLSRSAYLVSKIIILVLISAIQSFLFVIVGNSILGIEGMLLYYWLILFAVFAFANMLGLNISATFNSAVTIYILIPLLMIPQMALGGAMFSFNKLNRFIGSVDKVPLVAEFMSSRWAYEALMVHQFKNNSFEKIYFDVDRFKSIAGFKQTHYLAKLTEALDHTEILIDELEEAQGNKHMVDSVSNIMNQEFSFLKFQMQKESRKIIILKKELTKKKYIAPASDEVELVVPNELFKDLKIEGYSTEIIDQIAEYIKNWDDFYSQVYASADTRKEAYKNYQNNKEKGLYNKMRRKYDNEHLNDIVRNVYEKTKILRYKDELIQQDEPIFLEPSDDNFIGFRAHFYAPEKYFFGKMYSTFWFNLIVIWVMTMLLYIPLYYEHLKRLVDFFGTIKIPKLKLKKKKGDAKKLKITKNERK